MKSWKLSALIVLAASLVSSAPFAKTIKIGLAGPHSGPYAAFGDQLWHGATQAAADINTKGGINGKPIELIKADDACEPKQAVAVANRLVDYDDVDAVIGHFCSSSTIPASVVYNDANILMITPASTNPMVTDRGLESILRICGRDDQQGFIAADFIYNTLKARKVAVLHDKDTYGKGLADAMIAGLKAKGLEPVLYEGLTRGEKDFNAIITKLKEVKADALYFGGLHTEAGPLVRQLREQGSQIPFLSGDGIVSEEFVTSAGGPKMVKGVYMTFGADPRKMPEGAKVVKALRQEGFEPEGYTLYSYAALQAIQQAMTAVGSHDGDKLAQYLKTHSVATVMGPKAWDTKGDLQKTDYVMYVWDDKGSYHEYASNPSSSKT